MYNFMPFRARPTPFLRQTDMALPKFDGRPLRMVAIVHLSASRVNPVVEMPPARTTTSRPDSFPYNIGGEMRYLCLIYDDEQKINSFAKADQDAMFGEYMTFTEGIKKSGHYVGGEALQPVQSATTVRIRNGKISTTDGPFAETKEQLGGYYLIDAKDLNEAIQVAAKIPSARHGSVEIRPIVSFDSQ
jgi:hypothetical protein